MNARGFRVTTSYDLLQRPLKRVVQGNGLNNTVERLVYGEGQPNAANFNLRGRIYQHYDPAGLVQVPLYSFKGEARRTEQRIRSEYRQEANWPDGVGLGTLLEAETFVTTATFDALGRVVEHNTPDGSATRPEYLQSGRLNRVTTRIRGSTAFTELVHSIAYNAKGQRTQCEYANPTVSGTPVATLRAPSE